MRPTVLLFDVDGTLITTNGGARAAIERAFAERYGRTNGFDFPFDGMTDRAIVRRALERIEVEATEAEIDDFIAAYLSHLGEELDRAAACRLHRGVERAVDEALARENFAVGLGTGNVREGARLKLERVEFFHPFAFGGFGCDHEDRAELIRVGAERGAKRLGHPLSDCRVVVIGDTPKDVAAAHAIGAESIGVGTGSFSPEALLDAGATWAFPDLGGEDALAVLLGRGQFVGKREVGGLR